VDSFKAFNQEADAIDSHISSCRRLLPQFDQHLNPEELVSVLLILFLFVADVRGKKARVFVPGKPLQPSLK
jgi:hypothetical protein